MLVCVNKKIEKRFILTFYKYFFGQWDWNIRTFFLISHFYSFFKFNKSLCLKTGCFQFLTLN